MGRCTRWIARSTSAPMIGIRGMLLNGHALADILRANSARSIRHPAAGDDVVGSFDTGGSNR